MTSIKRRTLLTASGVGAATAAAGYAPFALAEDEANPFQLGVASGDATTDSVVLWTRLATEPTSPDLGMGGQPDTIPVHWRIATSAEAAKDDATSLYHGDTDALKKHCWSVHLDVKEAEGGGALKPGTRYFYQFTVFDAAHATVVGETKTAPEPDSDAEPNFAVISCQSAATDGELNDGPSYWHGYTHLADNPVDFVLHLGDYIYRESHENTVPKDKYCETLPDYRLRWGWYLERDNIQAARAIAGMYAVPDDHDIYNDYQGGNIKPNIGDGTDWQLKLFNNAHKAYWENMPLRGGPPELIEGTDKTRADLARVGVRWGANLEFTLMDCRQFRTDPAADKPTLLGTGQLADVLDWIKSSTSVWTVLGSTSPLSVYFSKPGVPAGPASWTEFPAEREQVTSALADKFADGGNPVAVAGDVHMPFVSKVIVPYDPSSKEFAATEFSTPSMSSYGSDWTRRLDTNPDVFVWGALRDDASGHP
ncbi:MAG: alkaline phosphatase D family protein, partial [Stackebrandtia sp.]